MIRILALILVFVALGLLIEGVRAALAPAPASDDQPPEPPESLDGATLSAWLHRVLTDAYAYEREAWAVERVRRVERRLQAGVPADQRLKVEILWIPEVTAFTLPGRYIYLSRHLLQRVDADEPIAFVIAHEMAHHALGHVRATERWMEPLSRIPGVDVLGTVFTEGSRWLRSPEDESAADEYALRLCADAGYDPARCLALMDVLEAYMLDSGDLRGVYGEAPTLAQIENGPGALDAIQKWLWTRKTGYPSLLDRRARLETIARDLSAATPSR